MGSVQKTCECAGCHTQVPDENGGVRKPCPNCGSMVRNLGVVATEEISIHEKLGLKTRTNGVPGVRQETVVGDDFHRDSQEWRKLERHLDHENNRYTEKITNPKTGEVLHETDEPLTSHTGHGAAKKPGHS